MSSSAMSINGVDDDAPINVQVFIPDLGVQKCICVGLDEIVWDIKRKVLAALNEPPPEAFNYGLFLPPCDGRAGKFLLEDRPIRDYPFHDCVPYLELKYKKRVYKMMKLDEKQLKQLHSKSNLKKFMEMVTHRQADRVEKMCTHGLDPNFHDGHGETPLTMAAAIPGSSDVMVALVGGGAHLDFRNAEGQTPMHKAAFLASCDNVKTLLELGASPNYRDPIGLTPLYYCMLTADTSADAAEMLLRDSADIGVTDMHGNHEIHQACKNGLTKHVEHLLYYGADADAMNVNGNTPLHVCAVNNRAECARVLLFRGADAGIVNKQGQTAFHVANIIGNQSVAEIIRTHNPTTSVPYRGMPRYNSKRRSAASIARRRSFSQSSICSQSSHNDQQSAYRSTGYGQSRCGSTAPSPSPSRVSIAFTDVSTASKRPSNAHAHPVDPRDFGTLPMRKFPPELVKTTNGGHEVNVPRILVIPRGPKGFGFILRGAKKMEPGVQFEPSAMVPALQFFEGVDMSGMAMKAGLRPGDFLIQINGVDVRRASHDQVVDLIQQADDTITLKVVTIDASRFVAGTMPARRARARSSLPPPPPARHPSTSLSTAKGGRFLTQSVFRYPDDQIYANGPRLVPAKSVESLPHSTNYVDPSAIHVVERVASVKTRPSSRRISAAELEHLMIRQSSTVSNESSSYDQDPLGPQTPKKFTSVADMKRRKNRMPPPSPQLPMGAGLPRVLYHDPQQQNRSQVSSSPVRPPLKSFASSPDLNGGDYDHEERHVFVPPPPPPQPSMLRRASTDSTNDMSDYSRPFRPTSRPKTPPPPPPPPPAPMPSNGHARQQQAQLQQRAGAAAPPPPPPPPPPEALRANAETSRVPPPPPIHGMSNGSSGSSAPKGDCRGVTADSLRGVQLKKTQPPADRGPGRVVENQSTPGISTSTLTGVKLKPAMKRDDSSSASINGGPSDFDSDLRNALAKRRTKVKSQESTDDEQKKVSFSPDGCSVSPSGVSNGNGTAHQSRFGGLSLKESVRENVPAKATKGKTQHSPPPVVNGFGNKKDSGYTSSRTSLEPSECGDETQYPTVLRVNDDSSPIAEVPDSPSFPPPPPAEFLNAAINCCAPDVASAASNRVSILSQQLEDSFGGQPPPALPKKPVGLKRELSRSGTQPHPMIREHDAMSVTSTLSTLSGCSEGASSGGRPDSSQAAVPHVPQPDYDAADSGTGDSDNDDVTPTISRIDLSCRSGGNEFGSKELSGWTPGDVCDWLDSLQLGEYKQRFLDAHITGRQLIVFDRARFTSLGVTRIAHRKLIEHSLKRIASPAVD